MTRSQIIECATIIVGLLLILWGATFALREWTAKKE